MFAEPVILLVWKGAKKEVSTLFRPIVALNTVSLPTPQFFSLFILLHYRGTSRSDAIGVTAASILEVSRGQAALFNTLGARTNPGLQGKVQFMTLPTIRTNSMTETFLTLYAAALQGRFKKWSQRVIKHQILRRDEAMLHYLTLWEIEKALPTWL